MSRVRSPNRNEQEGRSFRNLKVATGKGRVSAILGRSAEISYSFIAVAMFAKAGAWGLPTPWPGSSNNVPDRSWSNAPIET